MKTGEISRTQRDSAPPSMKARSMSERLGSMITSVGPRAAQSCVILSGGRCIRSKESL